MKIYVFSDSHGNCDTMCRILQEKRGDYDTVIHLGDHCADTRLIEPIIGLTPMISLVGNNDTDIPDPTWGTSCTVELGGMRFYLCHGHRQNVKQTYDILYTEAKRYNCCGVLFGHTHLPACETRENVTIFNPGSIGSPIFGRRPSYGVLTIEEEAGLIQYTIETV